MGERLTKAQVELLRRLAMTDQAVRWRASPVQSLWRRGYAEFDGRAGGELWWLTITPAGRAALQGGEHDD